MDTAATVGLGTGGGTMGMRKRKYEIGLLLLLIQRIPQR